MSRSDYIINTYAFTLTHTAKQALETLSHLGFDEFELMMYPGHIWPNEMDAGAVRKFKSYLADAGLKIRSLNQPNIDINLAGATPEMREYSIANLAGITRLAGELGAKGVVIGPGKVNPLMPMSREKLDGHFYRALDVLLPIANEAGVMLLVENMPFAYLSDIKSLLEVVDRYGADEIAIIYDLANGSFIKEDVGAALKLCRSRLKLIHVSDTGPTAYKHDAVGLGTMDFSKLLGDLKAASWDDRPVLEIIGISEDPTREILDTIDRLTAVGWAGQFGGK
ncbi:sugar phosphate isomerase/epimerase family protein [Aminobacter sp. MSH1]|uniref:sugar phosphate isomerase/epimerase family protein n=1 Tax=Aminobacter sp. MSH1 TaxID=374606 RepID=UPI000D3BD082|nr:sugar phosphate isomerase/epimerase family protein [Aminobacter sp. MSH1]